MPRYAVDVKAFITVEVEAASVKEARQRADAVVEETPLLVTDEDVGVVGSSGFDVDGVSEVEEV